MVLVGLSPPHDLNVRRETRKEIANIAVDVSRRSQTDSAVPSSYSWKPTNPVMSKQVHNADASPFWTATK